MKNLLIVQLSIVALLCIDAAHPGYAQRACSKIHLIYGCKCIDSPSEILNQFFDNSKSITFRSRAGTFYHSDSDTELTFLPRLNVTITEYGYVPTHYNGTYLICDDGTIELHLDKYPATWPKMVMVVCDKDVFLYTQLGDTEFQAGGRGAFVIIEGMKPFWPFKMVQPESANK